MQKQNKLLLIGLDGATFDVIKPLIDKGEMKHFASLLQRGTHAVLKSTIPTVSPVAWTTMITGVKPGKHNIFDFVSKEPGKTEFTMTRGGDRGVKPVWQILSDRGHKVGALNVTMSYPPEQINGFVVSGIDAPGTDSAFTFPPQLKDDLNAMVGQYNIVNPDALTSIDKHARGMYSMIDQRTEVALKLIEKYDPDFLMVTYIETDGSQHFFWKYFDRSHPDYDQKLAEKYGDVIDQVYRRIDSSIGKLLSAFDKDATVLVASDHGFGPLHKVFVLNNWLEREGYLKTFGKDSNPLKSLRTGVVRSAKNLIKKIIPKPLLSKIAKRSKQFTPPSLMSRIDWENTVAYSDSTCGNIYINTKNSGVGGTVSPGNYDKICNELIEKLKTVTDPENGKHPVKNALRKEGAFSGKFSDNAPDIVVIDNPGYFTCGNIYRLPKTDPGSAIGPKTLFIKHHWSGNHVEDGIFVIVGRGVKQGAELPPTQIANVTPTVLYSMNEPIPSEMDGKIVEAAFTEERLTKDKPQFCDEDIYVTPSTSAISQDEQESVKEHLRGLGYME